VTNVAHSVGHWQRSGRERTETSRQKLRAKFRAINAQTLLKTKEYQRPESKTIQQLAEPDEICKTSIPGSNPGGASKPNYFPVKK
jgi:hypothetical protein